MDAAMVALAFGAAINLATAQGALMCLVLLLAVRAVMNDPALQVARTRVGPAAAVTGLMLGAFALSSLVTTTPWPGWFEATRWRGLAAMPLGVLALGIRGPRLAARCLTVFAAGCAVHALVGIWQVRTGDHPLAELLQVPADRWVIPAPGRDDLRAAGGLFYNRVRLSHLLAAGTAACLGLTLWRRGLARAAWAMASAACFGGLMLTYGRAALGALVACVAVAAGLAAWRAGSARRRKLAVLGSGVLVAGVLVVGAVPAVRARMATAVDISRNQDRLFLWGRGSEMAMDHAPVGTGFGGYAMVRDAYYDRLYDAFRSRAMSHHLLLSLLAETGVAGLLLWLWAWWSLFALAWRSGHPVALCGALAAATFHAATLVHDPVYQSECAVAWAFCGALMATPPVQEQPNAALSGA